MFGQTTDEDWVKRGREFVAKGSDLADEAIICYNRALEINPKFAAAYYYRGMVQPRLDQRLADFTRAIELDPKPEGPYFERAQARRGSDADGAIADYTCVIERNGTFAENAYFARAEIKEKRRDLDGAIADYTHAIEHKSSFSGNLSIYWVARGYARHRQGKLDDAIADYDKALERGLRQNTFYGGETSFLRASACYTKGLWNEALTGFRQAIGICRDRMNGRARMHIWLAQTKLGNKKDADKELSGYMTAPDNQKYFDVWERSVAGFLLDEVTEAEMLAAVTDRLKDRVDLQSRAWFYAGIKRLFAGDKTGAADRFKKCLTFGGEYPEGEYGWAAAELRALEK